ncbi:MAG TPA: GxxExxY protein [Phycisphaerae bacterium]|nr:GxxExxY protein [Phycisphaerae bacterium]
MEKGNGTLSDRVLAAAVKVHKTLGVGFLEKVYENALMVEFRRQGIRAEQQKPVPVWYEDENVGDYVADIIVENTLIIELKAIRAFCDEHTACCMNYLQATNLPVCLLLNFGRRTLQIKRFVGEAYERCAQPI